jgi:uncharacterized membrane protein
MTNTHPWPIVAAIGALPTWLIAAICVLMIAAVVLMIVRGERAHRVVPVARRPGN